MRFPSRVAFSDFDYTPPGLSADVMFCLITLAFAWDYGVLSMVVDQGLLVTKKPCFVSLRSLYTDKLSLSVISLHFILISFQ